MSDTITAADIAASIDHTLLAPEATGRQVDQLCDEGLRYGFAGICVNPVFVRRVAMRIDRACDADRTLARPAVISVAGFPLGAECLETKTNQAYRAIQDGATEIDMVIHVGAIIEGERGLVRREIESMAAVVHGELPNGILKVILETAALTQDQIIQACRCCAEGEADFVKTSTGFHPAGGATVEHVKLLHRCASPLRVKASGGIRSVATALAMLRAGAARLGTSAGVAIIREAEYSSA